jgi:cytochrome b561
MPSSVLALGAAGLLDDFWLRRDPTTLGAIHALFGLSLCTLVIVRFNTRMRAITGPQACDIRSLSRHLSRTVYLLLALLVALKQIAGSGTEDLRDYLAYSLVALALIRLLALRYWMQIKPSSV